MKTDQFPFLTSARAGRHQWWRYVVFFMTSILVVIAFNQLLNQWAVPAIKASQIFEIVGQENITYLLVAFIFGSLFGLTVYLYPKLHQLPFEGLYQAPVNHTFRWLLYMKGFCQWGILLMVGQLISEWGQFQNFLNAFSLPMFLLAFLLAGAGLLVQTFWEELIMRGYLFQGLSLRFNRPMVPIAVVSLLFGLMHAGYGLESFLFSCLFSVVACLLTLHDNGLERAAGVHFANNLLLSLFFLDLSEATQSAFSWEINWLSAGLELLASGLLIWWSGAWKLFRNLKTELQPAENHPIIA